MSGFDDLDDLMKESTQLAAAKKAKAQGRKLKAGQEIVLATMRSFEERALWETKAIYIHTVKICCSCGECHKEFRGWYHYQQTRIGSGRRLERHTKPDHTAPLDLPVFHYGTEEKVDYCVHCLHLGEFPEAVVTSCDLLLELGEEVIVETVMATWESTDTPIIEEDDEDYDLTELNSDDPSGDIL